MQTIDEAKAHCRFVGKGIEKMVADGEDLRERFEGTQMIHIKIDKNGNSVTVIGGEMGGDDSGIVVSESGVTKRWGDEIVGYAFDGETRAALIEFFASCYYA